MTGEFTDKSGSYYSDDSSLLAAILSEHGPVTAFENAKRIADESGADAVALMRDAVTEMFHDSSNHARVLDYLQWDAEVHPDVEFANELSQGMSYYARYQESSDFAKEATAAAVVHLLRASDAPDFVADYDYANAAGSILDRADARGLKKQYEAALEFVAPHIVSAMVEHQKNKDSSDEDTDFEELELNQFLTTIAGTIHRRNPTMADLAQSAITHDKDKMMALESRSEHLIIDAFVAGRFDEARELIRDSESSLFMLWWALAEKAEDGASGREYARRSIDTLLEVRPEYFTEYSGETAIDIFFGGSTGKTLGLAGRSALIEPLLQPTESPMAARYTVMHCAYALGQTGNHEAYEAMLQMPNSGEYEEVIRLNFEAGLQNAIEM